MSKKRKTAKKSLFGSFFGSEYNAKKLARERKKPMAWRIKNF